MLNYSLLLLHSYHVKVFLYGKNAVIVEGITLDTEYNLDGRKAYKTPTENSMKLSKSELNLYTN